MAEKKDNKKDILWRIYFMYFCICLFGLAILVKVFAIQFIQGDYWKQKEHELTMKYFNIDASRGNIFSKDGSLLATSVPIFELRMDVNSDPVTDKIFNEKVDSLAIKLGQTFTYKDRSEWRTELKNARKRGERYFLIAKKVNYATLKEVRKFPIFKMGKYKGGLIVLQQSRRELPFKNLAQRTIGYDRVSNNPLGIEGAFNADLKGVSGKRLMQKIAGGIYKPINQDNEIEPQDGRDVVTTIDANIQDVAHHALEKQLIAQNADHGCAVLMEVKTGEVRAIVNLTRLDSNLYAETFNYAIAEATEPGSTFKLAAIMAAFEDGYTDLDEMVDTERGTHNFSGYIMKDSHEGGFGKITVKQVFEKSSNVGTSKLIYKYYGKTPQKFIDRLHSFGLQNKLGFSLPGEADPEIKTTKSKLWSAWSLPLMSIGYEEKLSPIQTLAFYNAVANNGVYLQPQFVKEIRSSGVLIKSFEPIVLNKKMCSIETIKKAKEMMEAVVSEGTATNLRNAPYQIAAKTGTAQIANGTLGYSSPTGKTYLASLCGYFPAKDPLYSIIVVVSNPRNKVIYGNDVAGPVFREIADKVYSNSTIIHKPLQMDTSANAVRVPYVKGGKQEDIQKISKQLAFTIKTSNPNCDFVSSQMLDSKIELVPFTYDENSVPNVVGMGLRDALSILENSFFNVKVVGRGVIKKQSIAAGKKVTKGSLITIELS
jgi:cell division protein FtsI (penicillin-binding protein 3)